MDKPDYLALLEHSYAVERETAECPPDSRMEYLAEQIFNFTTYDGEMSALFGRKAVEVCAAINDRATFDYIADPENYRWYLALCNMPFFADRLDWGTSVRGAWWGPYVPLESCGLWRGDEQLVSPLHFTPQEWLAFIAAVIEFGLGDGPA